jgi:hypothetical protein
MEKSHPFSQRLNRILEIKTENDQSLLHALSALSEFYPKNTPITRRNLRSTLESRGADYCRDYLRIMSEIQKVS